LQVPTRQCPALPLPLAHNAKTRHEAGFLHFVAGAGLAPATSRLCIPLRLSSLCRWADLWSGLYLHPLRGLPSSLYTCLRRCEGLARYYHLCLSKKDFTEFDRNSTHNCSYVSPR
jgi:hypothetical protein